MAKKPKQNPPPEITEEATPVTEAPRNNIAKHVPVGEVAKRLDVSSETLKRQLRNGTLPGVKVGTNWRVVPDAIMLALSNQTKKKGGGK